MEDLYIGVDLGGTNIKTGLFDDSGHLLSESREKTNHADGVDPVLERIAEMCCAIVRNNDYCWQQVKGIGVGMPALLDVENGILIVSGNLGWYDIPVRKKLEILLEKRIRIVNDANSAALAEAWLGAGAGVSHVVCATIGTGVGGGIVVRGEIFEGFTGMAGDIGHLPVKFGEEADICRGCGKRGCLESVASEPGMLNAAYKRIAAGERGMLSEQLPASSIDIFEAAGKGDAMAAAIVQDTADALARVFATLAVTLNPGRFIVGGGVSLAGDRLLVPVRQAFAEHAISAFVTKTDIVQAQLGNKAGMIGAARTAMTGT